MRLVGAVVAVLQFVGGDCLLQWAVEPDGCLLVVLLPDVEQWSEGVSGEVVGGTVALPVEVVLEDVVDHVVIAVWGGLHEDHK